MTELNYAEQIEINGGERFSGRREYREYRERQSRNRNRNREHKSKNGRDCSWKARDFTREVVKGGITGAFEGAVTGGLVTGGSGVVPGAATGAAAGAVTGGVGYAFDRAACKWGW